MSGQARPWYRALILLPVVVAAVVAAGCGVPARTAVEVDDVSGPEAELATSGVPRVPPGPDEAESPEELVEHFLTAAAGDPGNAVEELRPFIHPSQRDDWNPGPEVLVVRVEGDPLLTHVGPGPTTEVELTVLPKGTLANGIVEPLRQETRTFEFEVTIDRSVPEPSPAGGEGPHYRILDPPPVIMLSEQAALAVGLGYLEPTSIYFWDSDTEVLVPDLRWMPTALPSAQRIQTKLEWLIDGPAPWLESLAPLPGDLELESNPVLREDRLEVALTGAADSADPVRLDTQLWWTLREELEDLGTSLVSLAINGGQRDITATQRVKQALPYSQPRSFVVLNGELVAYVPADEVALPAGALVPGAQALALTGEGDDAALAQVHPGADGALRLSIGTEDGLVDTDLPVAGEMSRPVWLRQPRGTGLVAADGDLYRFSADGTTHPVTVPALTAGITDIAAAPDGRRVAMVAGGDLYTASLVRRSDGSVSVNRPRRLHTTADQLLGVAFIQENWLAVIGRGRGGESGLYEVTVDGAYERKLRSLGAPETVSHMVGYPGDPFSNTPRGRVMYEQDGLAYRYDFAERPEPIVAEEFEIELPEDGTEVEARMPVFAE